MATGYKCRFFQQEPDLSSIAKNKPLIEKLIGQITLFKASFEEQLKNSLPKEHKELEAAIRRSNLRLEALRDMEADRPISPEGEKLLVEYIKTMDKSSGYVEVHEEKAPDMAP